MMNLEKKRFIGWSGKMTKLENIKHTANFISRNKLQPSHRKEEHLKLFAKVIRAIASGNHNTTNKKLAEAAELSLGLMEYLE